MSSIGPELPPHLLAKRKRQAEEDLKQASKPSRSSSPDSNAEKKRRVAGPALPPGLSTNGDSPSRSPDSAAEKRRVAGPSLPPAPLDEKPSNPPNDEDSSDDSDFGPAMPPGPGEESTSYSHSQSWDLDASDGTAAEAKPQRAEWMLAPPTSGDLSSRQDPTKLRARKFASGKGAKAPQGKTQGIGALWTETPEQKMKRLEDEVMGVKRPATQDEGGDTIKTRERDREAEEAERRIREYNVSTANAEGCYRDIETNVVSNTGETPEQVTIRRA